MGKESAIDMLKTELHGLLDHVRTDLDRIEILVGALNGFSRPIPDYEPGFQHLRNFIQGASELGDKRARKKH